MELIAIVLIIAAVIVIEAIVFKKYALKGIEYSVSVDRIEVYEGEYIELTEIVKNNTLIGIPWIKTELSASRWLAFLKKDSAAQTASSENTFIPGVFSLKPKNMCTRIRRIKCIKRGVFSFDDTMITATDILGIIKTTKHIPVKITVTVLPVSADSSEAVLSFTEPIGEMLVRRFINDDPFMISGSREYTGREPISRIHWNYTAAKNDLMVYNNDYTTSRSVLIIMNMQRKGRLPVSCLHIRDLEAYIKLTVKLAEELIEQGNTCAFTTNGGKKDGVTSEIIKNTEQFEILLRQLANIDTICDTDIADHINNVNPTQFTDIILITSYIDNILLRFAEKNIDYGKNLIIYTTEENDENDTEIQFLPINRFSFRWNTEEV